jgi:hypothetical protein
MSRPSPQPYTYRRDRQGECWHIMRAGERGPRGQTLCGEPRQGTRLSEAYAEMNLARRSASASAAPMLTARNAQAAPGMSDFLRRTQPRHPVAAPAQSLARDGLPPGCDPATLIVRELTRLVLRPPRELFSGHQSGPHHRAGHSGGVFNDLDDHPEFTVGSGHLDQDGALVLTRRDGGPRSPRQTRTRQIEPITAATSNSSSRVRPLERQPSTKGKQE